MATISRTTCVTSSAFPGARLGLTNCVRSAFGTSNAFRKCVGPMVPAYLTIAAGRYRNAKSLLPMRLCLRVDGSSLECNDDSGFTRWSLSIQTIVLIAEYTTNEGPWLDDYFLVFVTVEEGKLYFSTCSFYAD